MYRGVPAQDKKRGPKNPKFPPKMIGLLRWIFCSSSSWAWAHHYILKAHSTIASLTAGGSGLRRGVVVLECAVLQHKRGPNYKTSPK